MVSLLLQLIGDPARASDGLQPVPAEHAVRRLAGAAARARRLGADRPRGLGVLALRACPRCVGAYLVFLRRDVAGG